MRIIHTADWHLCDRLGRVDRTQDLRDRVEKVAEFCENQNADVLLIAGDLFCEGAHVTLDVMNQSLDHLFKTFANFFAKNGTIIAIAGNHDRETRIESLRQGMRLATPSGGSRFQPGRMYLQNGPFVGTLETTSRHTGTREKTQFVLLPYPTTVRYGINGRGFPSKAEENRELSNRVAEWLKNEAIHKLDSMVPTVLMGHLHIAGAGLSHTLYNITEADDVVFDTGPLIGPWQYIALGHIHKAQTIGGEKHIRYAGSLDRLHMDEREYETGVVRFDIGKNGLEGEPEVLPIEPTPMYQVEIVDPANELETLAERVPNCETALVHVTATYVPGGPSRDEIERKVRETFKRYTHLTWTRCESAANGTATRVTPTANYREAVRNYLATQLNNDPDSAELTKLAESFLTQEAAQ